jgi:hypothetical protein
MAIYFPRNQKGSRALSHIRDEDKYNNQVVLNGADDEFLVPNGTFFLEYLLIEAGVSVTIKDGFNNTVADGVTAFNQEHSPLRLEGGIKITGTVLIAKGFALRESASK